MSDLRIEVRDLPEGVTILALEGVLDSRSTKQLEERMGALMDAEKLRIAVHCGGLAHLSSDGMGVFLAHLIKIRKRGGDIKFCEMNEDVKGVISVLGLGKLLVVKGSERDAVSEFLTTAAREKPREAEKLRIVVSDAGAVAICSLYGFVDRHTIGQLDEVLSGLLADKKPQIVIDCAELTYISSNGMGVFISYVSKARGMGGDIRLCNMRDIARTVITMLGLHRLFEVFESQDEAIASYA